MNKKLLAVAMGTALVGSMAVFASTASADVQLYGQVDVSIDSHDCDGGAYGGCNGYSANSGFQPNDKSQSVNMNGNYSYFGIKGSEDLGNGLKAIFNVAFTYDPAGNGGTYGGLGYGGVGGIGGGSIGGLFSGNHGQGSSLADNEKWLGIAGDFGTVRAGTVFTPYKEHGESIDPFYGTSLEGHQAGLQSGLNNEFVATDYAVTGLVNRTIRYDSPDMNGLSASAFYTMGHGTTPDPTDYNLGNPYGIGGQYKNGNILAFADYQSANLDSTQYPSSVMDDDTAWDLGGQYTMGNMAFFGRYESGGLVSLNMSSSDGSFMGGESGASVWHLGGSFTMGNTLLYAAYGQGDASTDTAKVSAIAHSEDKYSAWTLGVKHSLSTRTSVYAGFNQIDQDVVGQSDHFGLGMNVKF